MPTFFYKALQADGKTTEGQLEAGGRAEAFRQMESQSLRPISLKEGVNGKSKALVTKTAVSTASASSEAAAESGKAEPGMKISFGSDKISARVLENFTRLLSSLLAAGVPLSRALVILQKEAANPAARAKWKEVHD